MTCIVKQTRIVLMLVIGKWGIIAVMETTNAAQMLCFAIALQKQMLC